MAARGDIEMEGRPLLNVTSASAGIDSKADPNSLTGGFTAAIAHRPSFAHTEVKLADVNQKVLAQPGAMLWMDGKMGLSTGCHNGCATSYCRTCSDEPCCLNTFSGPGDVAFGFELPGDILPFATTETEGWILNQRSFVCGTTNLKISSQFVGCMACVCAPCVNEGTFLTHVSAEVGKGNALFFAGNYGQIQRHEVPSGKKFLVHAGLFFAASDKTAIDVGMPGGCFSLCFSGEGLVMKFTGPCTVFTQNKATSHMIKKLHPHGHPRKQKHPLRIMRKIIFHLIKGIIEILKNIN